MRFPYFLLLFVFVFPSVVEAQAPGYVGKRFSIEFNTQLNISALLPSTDPSRDFGLNRTFTGGLAYSISRLSSIDLRYTKYVTGLNSSYSIEDLRVTNYHHLNATKIGLRYNRFKPLNGSLAPLGVLRYVGINRVSAKGEIISRNENSLPVLLSESTPDKLIQDVSTLAIEVGFSKSTMIFENIYFKRGMAFSILLSQSFYKDLNSDPFDMKDYGDNREEAMWEEVALRRIFAHDFMFFEFGIGVLLF